MHANGDKVDMVKEGYVNVQGGKIWFQMYTNNESPHTVPIIILHGGPGTPHNYLLNLSELVKYRTVIFYDQLGCGKSSLQSNQKELWTITRFVSELEELAQALKLPQFHLYGHSWGGSLAIEYALLYPKKVKSMILASPVLSVPLWLKDTKKLLQQLPLSTQQIIIKHEEAGTTGSAEYQDAKRVFNNLLCRLDSDPENLQYSLSHSNSEVYQTMWGPSEFTVTGNLKNFDRINDLEKLTMPILMTCGRFDEAAPETMQYAKHKSINAKLVIFEKSAHVPHLEEEEKYLNILVDFLGNVEKS
jgi:proline iminopeptidase